MRILVIHRRYLGDLILVEPFLRNLRSAHPGAEITLVADQGYAEVLRGCDSIDVLAELPRGGRLREHWNAWWRFLRALGSERFDLAFDLTRNERAALVLLLARARRRVSYEIEGDIAVRRRRRSDAWRRRLLSTDLLRMTRAEQKSMHVVDFHNRLLERVGIETPHSVPRLVVREGDRRRAAQLLARAVGSRDGRPRVLIHAGARKEAKRWPAERFADLSDRLARDLGCLPIVLVGPGEEVIAREIAARRRERVGASLDEPIDLALLFGLAAECDLFVGNDSAAAHMAAAVGTPTCVLFGDASTTMWRTRGPLDRALQAERPCGEACVRPDVCGPGADRYCVRRIEVDEVVAAVAEILERRGRREATGAPEPRAAAEACPSARRPARGGA